MSVSTASNSNIYKIISDAAGLVGIGTSSPGNLLDVNGNITIRDAYYLNFGNPGSGDVSIRPTGSGGARGMSFYTYNGATARRMDIDVNGLVGIGTSSPSEKLSVLDGNFLISKTSYGGILKWTQGTTSPRAGLWEWGDGTGWRMDFGPSATPRLSIYDNGNVGIGNITPDGLLGFKNTATFADKLIHFPLSTYTLYLRPTGTGGQLQMWSDETTANVMTWTTAGNVGIGTTSPAQNLEVKSAAAYILVNSTNAFYGGGYYISHNSVEKWHITNEPGAGHGLYIRDAANDTGVALGQDTTAWVAASDFRLKDVKETIANALDKVNQLTGVKFTWKRDADKPDAKTRVGLIAQDVLSVLPEAVSDDTPDLVTDEVTGKVSGGLGVRYTELIPLLVNAIKELTTRIATLEQRA